VVAVLPARLPAYAKVYAPGARTGAVEGAETAMEVATVLTAGLWPIFFYGAGFVGVPLIGATVGAIMGADDAPPKDEAREVAEVLQSVIEEARVSERIQSAIVKQLERAPGVSRADAWPEFSDEDQSNALRTLQAAGFDTLLELDIDDLEVTGPWEDRPGSPLVLSATVRLVGVPGGSELYEQEVRYESQVSTESLRGWERGLEGETDHAAPLRKALEAAAEGLGRTIVNIMWSMTSGTGMGAGSGS
jgi:hypothetical protein